MNLVNMFEDAGDVAVFEIDNERAYEQVMDKFGHIIEWSGDFMVAPRNVFTQIEQVAHDAGGAANEITDDMFEATGLTFMGSPCTKDCSGHKAGYEWSEKRGGQNANSHSQSFNNGAAISVNAKNKQQQPAQQTKPQTAADKLRAKMADLLGPDKAKTFGLAEGSDMCKVCGQTPCNCTSISEGGVSKKDIAVSKKKIDAKRTELEKQGVKKSQLGEPGYYLDAELRNANKQGVAEGANPVEDYQLAAAKNYAKAAKVAKQKGDTKAYHQSMLDYHANMMTHYFLNSRYDQGEKHEAAMDRHEEMLNQLDPQGVVEGKFNELSVMIADYHNSNITDVKFYGMYGKTRQQVAKEYANYLEEGMGDEFGQKELKHTIARARAKFPRAASDTEALIMYVQDQEQQDVRKLDQVNDREDKEIDRLEQEDDSIEQRLQNVERKVGMMESRLYYSVVGTVDSKLRSEFGLRKDKNGWYLKESADPKIKYSVYKAFGSPKLKEYDLSAVRGGSTGVISGADNPVSPVGSVPRGQQKTRR